MQPSFVVGKYPKAALKVKMFCSYLLNAQNSTEARQTLPIEGCWYELTIRKCCICQDMRFKELTQETPTCKMWNSNLFYWFSFYFVCRGVIVLENKTFIIEPVSGHDNEAHFIYRVENLRLTQGDCGHGFNMTSVFFKNHIKNPFQSSRTRVRAALSGFIKLVFIPLLSAVETEFQCCLGVRSWFGVVFISVVNKKAGHLTQHHQTGKSARLDPVPEGIALDLTHFICT